MLSKISGTILEVNVLPEYETEIEQEIDIVLDDGLLVEMCVTKDVLAMLRSSIRKTATFEITDHSPCGQYTRAKSWKIQSS